MRRAAPQQHTVFGAGRLSRVVRPTCLAPSPSCRTAAAAACSRLSTPAVCIRHTAARPLVSCAARNADGRQAHGLPQQNGDAPAAASQPTTPRRTRSSYTYVRDVPWNDAAKAAVLQFWTDQGALQLVAEVQPEQQAEQRRLRSKILSWAAKHPRHRDVEFLTDYMARVHNAVAASGWAGEPWRLALGQHSSVSSNLSPANLLHRVQSVQQMLAEHGVSLTPSQCLMIKIPSKPAAGRVANLLRVLKSPPFRLELPAIVQRAPGLLNIQHPDILLVRRAAMQQLHPQLDLGRVLTRQPSLLILTEETLAARWAALQAASRLGDDEMWALAEGRPALLGLSPGVIGWKCQQIRAYDLARERAGAARTRLSSMSMMLTSAPYRVWRLRYLTSAAIIQKAALTWVTMGEEAFAALNPHYNLWLESHPIPPEAYRNCYT